MYINYILLSNVRSTLYTKKKNFFSIRIFCTVKILEKFRPLLKTENSCQCLKDFKSSLNIQKKNLQK